MDFGSIAALDECDASLIHIMPAVREWLVVQLFFLGSSLTHEIGVTEISLYGTEALLSASLRCLSRSNSVSLSYSLGHPTLPDHLCIWHLLPSLVPYQLSYQRLVPRLSAANYHLLMTRYSVFLLLIHVWACLSIHSWLLSICHSPHTRQNIFSLLRDSTAGWTKLCQHIIG